MAMVSCLTECVKVNSHVVILVPFVLVFLCNVSSTIHDLHSLHILNWWKPCLKHCEHFFMFLSNCTQSSLFSVGYFCLYYVVFVARDITLMMMSGTACATLTFDNCVNCTDVNPATSKAQCTKCGPGYTLKDDNSTCTSTFCDCLKFWTKIPSDTPMLRRTGRVIGIRLICWHTVVTLWPHLDAIASLKHVGICHDFSVKMVVLTYFSVCMVICSLFL